MDDQTYLLIKLAAGVACLLLALIPAFIGKRKGYRFAAYYALGVASFLLALIVALAVRPRENRIPREDDIPPFRPGRAAVYLTLAAAALYTLAVVYNLLVRNGFLQAMIQGNSLNMFMSLVPRILLIILSMWVLAGGLLAALNARTHRRALVITLLSLTAFAVVTITANFSYYFGVYSDGIDAYYLMPFAAALYMLALVPALLSEDRPVSITAGVAGIVCAALYSLFFIALIAQHLNARILLSMLLGGTLLWTFGVITAFAAVLSGLSKRNMAQRAAFAAEPGAVPAAPPQAAIPQPPAQQAVAGAEAPAPAMIVFAAASANAASMAMFGNTQQYYSPEYCISRVRANFHLPADARIDYVARASWNGPVPELDGDQFRIDLPLVQRLQQAYLTEQLGLSEADAVAAVGRAQAMQAPRLGLLWLCVPLGNQ